MRVKTGTLTVALMVGLAMVAAATGTSESDGSRQAVGVVKVALDAPPDPETSGAYVWASTFVEYLETNGVETSVYQRDALGGEEEKLDQVRQALLEVSMSDVAMVGELEKMIFGFTQPYMFQSLEHLDRTVANSDLMQRINDSIATEGVRVLALVSPGAATGIANTKRTIRTPADLEGLRIRAKDGMQAQFIQAWGANTVVVPWGEIYNALQTGVADGYMNPAIVPIMFKHEEILTHFSDIAFGVPLRLAICSEEWYQSLPEEYRHIVDDAVDEANAANREWTARIGSQGLDKLREAGIQVYDNSPEEISQFARVVQPLYSQTLGEETAELFLEASRANQ